MCSYLNRDYIDYAPIRNSSSLNSSDGCLDSIHYRPQAAMDSPHVYLRVAPLTHRFDTVR
jgi:hypothetical protein